jgi:hypothetical protein
MADESTGYLTASGSVVRWDPTGPSLLNTPTNDISGVFARSSNEIYFLFGSPHGLYRCDGGSCMDLGIGFGFNGGLTGDRATGNLYSCDFMGCYRYDGTLHSANLPAVPGSFMARDMAEVSWGHAVLCGAYLNGAPPTSPMILDFTGTTVTVGTLPADDGGARDCHMGGEAGEALLALGADVYVTDGGAYSPFVNCTDCTSGLWSMVRTAPGHFWALDSSGARELVGNQWVVRVRGSFDVLDVRGNVGLASGYNQLVRLNAADAGVHLLTYPLPPSDPTTQQFQLNYGITGTSNSDVWVFSQNGTWRFNGSSWSSDTTPNPTAFTGGAGGVYTVFSTLTSTTLHDSAGTHPLSATTFDAGAAVATDIWANASTDVWVAGAATSAMTRPFLAHWNGSAWSPVATPDAGGLNAVWASFFGQIWIGGNGALYQFDGAVWRDQSSSLTPGDTVRDIYGDGSNRVWIGGNRTIYFWDGGTVTTEETGLGAFGFAETAHGELWAQMFGAAVVRTPSGWQDAHSDTSVNVTSIWASPDGGLWVAGKGASILFRP